MKNFERRFETREKKPKVLMPAVLLATLVAACGSPEDPSAAQVRDASDMGADLGSSDFGIADQGLDTGFNEPDDGTPVDSGPDTPDDGQPDLGPVCNATTPEEVITLIRESFVYESPSDPIPGASNESPKVTITNDPNSILQVGNSASNCKVNHVFYKPGESNFTKDLTIGQDCVDENLRAALQLKEGRLSAGQARLHGGLWVFSEGNSNFELSHYPSPTIENEALIPGDMDAFVRLNGSNGELEYKTSQAENSTTLSDICVDNLVEISREMTNTLTTYKSDAGL